MEVGREFQRVVAMGVKEKRLHGRGLEEGDEEVGRVR